MKYSFIKVGEDVKWSDPDGDQSSGIYKVISINNNNKDIEDDTVILINNAESEAEAYARELSPVLKEFNKGYWCALQDAISNGANTAVINSMFKCAGFTYDECMRHIEASDFHKDKLLPVIKSMFPEESKHFAEIEMITWNGRQYPSKSFTIFEGASDELEVIASIEELVNVLLDQTTCLPVSDEAEELDNKIYYYLSKEDFELSDDEIIEILENA